MLVTLSGMVMDVKPLQSSKALIPMLVTLSGMVTNVKSVYPSKAALPILVTAPPSYSEGITTVERVPIYLVTSQRLLLSDVNVNSPSGVSSITPQTHIPVVPKSCAAISVLLLQRAHTFQWFSESENHSALLVSCPRAATSLLSVVASQRVQCRDSLPTPSHVGLTSTVYSSA